MHDPTTVASLRQAFLDFLAAVKWNIEADVDYTSTGTPIDCSTFTISGPLFDLEYFLEALQVPRSVYDSWGEALQQAIDPSSQPMCSCGTPGCPYGCLPNESDASIYGVRR